MEEGLPAGGGGGTTELAEGNDGVVLCAGGEGAFFIAARLVSSKLSIIGIR